MPVTALMPLRAESRRQHGALVLGRPATRRLEQPRERALTARDDPRHVQIRQARALDRQLGGLRVQIEERYAARTRRLERLVGHLMREAFSGDQRQSAAISSTRCAASRPLRVTCTAKEVPTKTTA